YGTAWKRIRHPCPGFPPGCCSKRRLCSRYLRGAPTTIQCPRATVDQISREHWLLRKLQDQAVRVGGRRAPKSSAASPRIRPGWWVSPPAPTADAQVHKCRAASATTGCEAAPAAASSRRRRVLCAGLSFYGERFPLHRFQPPSRGSRHLCPDDRGLR